MLNNIRAALTGILGAAVALGILPPDLAELLDHHAAEITGAILLIWASVTAIRNHLETNDESE